ncbi:MAG: cation:proton antiporter [bacterium]
MEVLLLRDIFAILALSVIVILVFHRFQVPATVGFLFTGVIAGPHGLGLVSAVHEVEILAEIGIVLLLFTIGIEFSLKKLIQIKKAVFLGGTVQVLLTILVVAVFVGLAGFPFNQAVFFGFLISLSSTAIVLKVLQDRAQIDSPHGQTSLAILIYQDLIIVPMILLTPILAGKTANLAESLLMLTLKVAGVLVLTVVLAKWLVHGILFQVVKTRSRELFLMSVLVTCLAVAWLTSSLGLSLAMGAFLAGLIISESEYSSHAFGHVLPFRDLFTSFFFVYIGMLLNVNYLYSQPILIILVVISLLILKTAVAGFVGTLLGLSLRTALLVGFTLAQIGEFSFLLSRFGLNEGLISANTYQLFLSASVLSMAATPFIIASAPRLADWILKLPLPDRIIIGLYPVDATAEQKLSDHLVIVGFGINGSNVAQAARMSGIPYVIVEMNPATVRREQARGEPIFYGDASKEEVLSHARIEVASVLVVAIPDAVATERITELAHKLNPEAYLIVRTRFLQEVDQLYRLGANEVIPEEFETSIKIFTRVLDRFALPEGKVNRIIADIRAECYRVFRKSHSTENLQARLYKGD